MATPERIWLQTAPSDDPGAPIPWTWADHEVDASDTEYIRADLHPSYAALAVCEAITRLYSPDGTWLGGILEEDGGDPFPHLWRLVQLVVNAPRPDGRWAPYEGVMREIASMLTGKSIDEVTAPLSELLLTLRYKHLEDVPGMVVTDVEAWEYEGEDGG